MLPEMAAGTGHAGGGGGTEGASSSSDDVLGEAATGNGLEIAGTA